MNRIATAFCFILAICTAAQAATDTQLAVLLKGKVQEINDAVIKEDYGRVADLTHPKVIEMLGGRDKMISTMSAALKEMKARGYAFHSVKVDEPSDPVTAAADLYAVVPFTFEMTAPGGKLLVKSFVIGVSSDQGRTWVFINGDIDIKIVKQVLPNLPDQLKLPEKQQPVFEK